MSTEFDNLEQAVEREMPILNGLPAAAPRAECVARIKAAMQAESVRVVRRRRMLRWARFSGLGAAAVVLVAGWAVVHERSIATERAGREADAVVSQWAAALDESDRRLTNLAEYGWTHGEFSRDEDAEMDGLLQGLGQSFEHFDAL